MMRKLPLALMVFGLVAAAVPAGAQEVKIGYVDFQRILDQSKRGQAAKDLLAQEQEFRAEKLKKSEEDFKQKIGDLEKKRTVLSPEAFQKEQEKVLMEREELARRMQELRTGLFEKEQQLTRDIYDDVQGILKELARKEGYSLILEKQQGGILYAPEKNDLTTKVLDLYNARSKPAGGKK